MDLRDLKVLHWRGPHTPVAPVVSGNAPRDVFLIDTCQRRVMVVDGRDSAERAKHRFPDDGAVEDFDGVDAYSFLLRFACGLESKLTAETEIFGQIKQAWRDFSAGKSSLAQQLSPWIQLLFQDVKAVRAYYLAKLGSASYGSQVRRLLGDEARSGAILLIGAGQLAQAVAPWLTGTELLLFNRTPERAIELSRELVKRDPKRPVRVIEGGTQGELAAWRQVQHVIVCVPPDAQMDPLRMAAWTERAAIGGRLVHLGLAGHGTPAWNAIPELVSLGSMFEMMQAQSEMRRRQIERARRACLEKALLRSLGASSSHPHSWEDLTAFHCL